MNEDDLLLQCSKAKKRVSRTYKTLRRVQMIMHRVESRYHFEKGEFERIDLELAMIDGRYQHLQEQREEEKLRNENKKLVAKISPEKLIQIAQALGVELEVVG